MCATKMLWLQWLMSGSVKMYFPTVKQLEHKSRNSEKNKNEKKK